MQIIGANGEAEPTFTEEELKKAVEGNLVTEIKVVKEVWIVWKDGKRVR